MKVIKKCIALLLTVSLLMGTAAPAFSAEEVNAEQEDWTMIAEKYDDQAHILSSQLGQPSNLWYWTMAQEIEKDHRLTATAIKAASEICGVGLTEERCTELIANMLALQKAELASQMEQQSKYDSLKGGDDYALDLAGIAVSALGLDIGSAANRNLEEIPEVKELWPIVDAVTSRKDPIMGNIAHAQYYETVIKEYVQEKAFLEAVANHATNKNMKKAAKQLLKDKTPITMLSAQMDYLGKQLKEEEKYTANLLFNNDIFTEALKQTSEDSKSAVAFLNKFQDISAKYSTGKFAFDLTMFCGDILFGTTNIFNRYEEMKAMADIAQSLTAANNEISIPKGEATAETVAAIKKKCAYYKMLTAVHTRGEYLIYSLVMEDAGILSNHQRNLDLFKVMGDSNKEKYQKQIDNLKYLDNRIDDIFIAEPSDWLNEQMVSYCGGMYAVGTSKATYTFRKQNSHYAVYDVVKLRDKRQGLVSGGLCDLNDDGSLEMVLTYMKQSEENQTVDLNVAVYERQNGQLQLKSDVCVYSFNTVDDSDVHVGFLTAKGRNYVYLEGYSFGKLVDYWYPHYRLFAYENGVLYCYANLKQSGGGTSEIEYSLTIKDASDAYEQQSIIWQDCTAQQYSGNIGLYNNMESGEAFAEAMASLGIVEPEKYWDFATDYPSYLNEQDELCSVKTTVNDYWETNIAVCTMTVTDKTGVNTSTEKPEDFSWAEPGPQISLAEDQAYKIACEYWNMPEHDYFIAKSVEEGTPTKHTVMEDGIAETKTKAYYVYRLLWLVDEGTEMEHWSTIDLVYIDAVTGEKFSYVSTETGETLPPNHE